MRRALRLGRIASYFGYVVLAAISGCRLGGGSGIGDPWALASTRGDAGVADTAEAGRGGTGGGNAASAGRDATSVDAAAPASPGALDAGAAFTADANADPSAAQDAGKCSAPTVSVCDPVANTGCGAGMQCNVDLLQPILAGICTFSSPNDGGPCFNSGFTESCPPTSTCRDGQCRNLCFCDTDCPQGECCHDTLGALGFRLCAPCP